MTGKPIGRAALLIAGLLLFVTTPMRAAPSAEGDAAVEQATEAGKPLALTKAKKSRLHKASRSRKAVHVAARKSTPAPTQTEQPSAMPDAVANANAQMPAASAHGAAAAVDTPPLEAAAAEQLNELGKSMAAPADTPQQFAQLTVAEPAPAAPPLVTPEPTRPLKQARAALSNDAWAQSSLIGKIFIAFGGMLTLASAARMLVA